jgi:hypothetical protein
MSLKAKSNWFRRIGLATIAVCAVGTAALSAAPAEAGVRVFTGRSGLHVAIGHQPHHGWGHHSNWHRGGGWYR